MSRAPDPALIEPSQTGPLPIVGRDGREPWRVYARPFKDDGKRPRIAVVLYGLGMSAAATKAAIQGLPGAVTLAFAPYADNLRNWIAQARAAGHEALLMVPMEPGDFPVSDPGPRALLTSLSPEQNVERLEWVLSRAVGYVGVTEFMGSRFAESGRHMTALLTALRRRGLLFLASRPETARMGSGLAVRLKLPFASNALFVDGRASRGAIDRQLLELERLAKSSGSAIGMGFPYPVTLERVARWARDVESRGMVLAPVSALARRSAS